MLNLIKKVHFDRYDQQGKKIPDNSKHENTFHPFVDAPIPLPNGDKNIILLFCENIRDGVGDYQHLQNYYYRVKALVGEHYIVRPILTANKTPVKPKAKTYVIHQLGNANQDRVIQAYHELCKTEGIEPLLNLEFNDPMLKDLIERAAAIFDISYGGNGRVLSEKHPSLFPVKCPQLNGGGYFLSDETNALGLHFAGMGLPNSRNQPVYGLNLDQTVFDRRDAARALTSFKSPARKTLVKHLLQNEVTHEQAEHYLASHKFMPGYPQSDWAAHNFILTGILKNMNNNQLLVNCDFVLPKKCYCKR